VSTVVNCKCIQIPKSDDPGWLFFQALERAPLACQEEIKGIKIKPQVWRLHRIMVTHCDDHTDIITALHRWQRTMIGKHPRA